MSEAWQRARLAELCMSAGLSEAEQYFLQSVIRLADTSGVLTDNALAVRTASLAVPWASSLSIAHQEGQPYWKYVKRALQSALNSCNRLQPDRLALPTALSWRDTISSMLIGPHSGGLPLKVSASQVEAHQLETCSLVLTKTVNPLLTTAMLELLAAEVALGLISRLTDIGQILSEAKNLSSREPDFRPKLARLLAGQTKEFNVLVPVGGASSLDEIDKLNPTANLRQVRLGVKRSFAGWGRAGPKARDFVEKFERSLNHPDIRARFRRQRIVVSATVRASDIRAAAAIGQLTVAEALDQYVAGHPFVHFEIDDTIGVGQLDKTWVQPVSLRPPLEGVVKPMAIPWPDILRRSMRVAHLLRDATAPMSRVALGWVMIESSGLGPDDSVIDSIAKTLALETLRQSAFVPYRFLVQDAIDRQAVRYYKERAETRRRSAKNKLRVAKTAGVPAPITVSLRWESSRAELTAAMYEVLAQKADEESSVRRAHLARVDSRINPTVDPMIGHRGYLPSVTRWLSVLWDNWESSSSDEASALRSLLGDVAVPTRVSVENLVHLVRSGTLAAKHLTESRSWLVAILDAFYAARNLNLHKGVFTSEGDIALGKLAVLVSDTLFEVWATWYSNGKGKGLTASQIVQDVADRYDRIVNYLHGGGP